MSCRQDYPANRDRLWGQTMGQLFCSLLATLVEVMVEGDIDGARPFTQLPELFGVEMRAQRAGHVGEARLAQHRIVEQALDKNHLGAIPNLAGQEGMGEAAPRLRP